MRKIPFYLLITFIITSCDSKEDLTTKSQALNNPMQLYIINGDIEYYSEITDGSKPKKPIFIYDIPDKTNEVDNSTSKTLEQSLNLNFGYGIGDLTKSGCTVKRYNNGNSYYTDAGVFGFIPYAFPNSNPGTKSYLIRGYGTPHLNPSYGSLVLIASNKGYKIQNTRGTWHDNQQKGTALSIEYTFKANTTYEISINVGFHDNRYSIDKVFSSGYPTLYAQLKNNGIISVLNYRDKTLRDPCTNIGINDLEQSAYNYQNYTRSYTLDSRAIMLRTLVFKFSPTEEKKALLISLHPAIGEAGYLAPIPTNSYTMRLPLITISEKPFDPSLNVPDTVNPRGR